jgi:aspartyl-tRNA(Asn)/glutamyl-tRNA(Gln) amidotransferase subunit C
VYHFAPIFPQFCEHGITTEPEGQDMKPEQIASIAHLARLSMDEAEIPRYQESLTSILSFVGDLERAQTEGVAPMAHPLPGLVQRLRADVATETDAHERYQANAPQVAAALYLVPKVIE